MLDGITLRGDGNQAANCPHKAEVEVQILAPQPPIRNPLAQIGQKVPPVQSKRINPSPLGGTGIPEGEMGREPEKAGKR